MKNMKYEDISFKISRKVDVEVCIAELDIETQKHGRLYLPILLLAKENNNKINENDLVDKFKFPVPMAKQVLDRCRKMNLIKPDMYYPEHYFIDELGELLIKDNKVFVKENGVYRVFYTEDPLLPQKVITLQRIHKDEKEITRNRDIKELPKIEGRFQNLFPMEKEAEFNFINSGNISIEKWYEQGIFDKNNRLKLEIIGEFTPNKDPVFKVELKFEKEKNEFTLNKINENCSFSHLFAHILDKSEESDNFDFVTGKLNVDFEDIKNNTRSINEFVKDLYIKDSTFEGFGTFNPIRITLPIKPKDDSSALKWAKELLFNEINTFCNQKEYDTKKRKIEERFFEFTDMRVQLPNIEEFAEEIKTKSLIQETSNVRDYGPRSRQYWLLQASIDFDLI